VPSEPSATAPIVCVWSTGQAAVKVLPASMLFQMPPPDTARYNVWAAVLVFTHRRPRGPEATHPAVLDLEDQIRKVKIHALTT
jgi:hypothetical protein